MAAILAGIALFKAAFLDIRVLAAIAVAFMALSLQKAVHDRDAWMHSAQAWQAATASWTSAYHTDADRRAFELQDAVTAVNAVQADCDARAARAENVKAAIAALVSKEPARVPLPANATSCPARELIPAGELRDALAAGAGGKP